MLADARAGACSAWWPARCCSAGLGVATLTRGAGGACGRTRAGAAAGGGRGARRRGAAHHPAGLRQRSLGIAAASSRSSAKALWRAVRRSGFRSSARDAARRISAARAGHRPRPKRIRHAASCARRQPVAARRGLRGVDCSSRAHARRAPEFKKASHNGRYQQQRRADRARGRRRASSRPGIHVLGQYIKDLSFENPGAPRSLRPSDKAPKLDVNVNVNARPQSQTRLRDRAEARREGRARRRDALHRRGDLCRPFPDPQRAAGARAPAAADRVPAAALPLRAADRCRRHAAGRLSAADDRPGRFHRALSAAHGASRTPQQKAARSRADDVPTASASALAAAFRRPIAEPERRRRRGRRRTRRCASSSSGVRRGASGRGRAATLRSIADRRARPARERAERQASPAGRRAARDRLRPGSPRRAARRA